MKHKLLSLALLFLLFMGFSSPAYAQGPSGDQFILGNNHTIGANETVNGDVYVAGGNLDLEAGGTIDGDLFVFGGNADIEGTITGDMTVFGGNADLTESAAVEGDINVFGGNLSRDEGSQVGGEIEENNKFDFEPPAPPSPPSAYSGDSFFGRVAGFFIDTTWNLMLLIGLALIAWLVAAFLPEQMQVVGETVTQAKLLSFGMGFLTAILAAILAIPAALLVATICLAIVPIAGYTLLVGAVLLGWIVIGQLVGEQLLTSVERPLPGLVLSTIVGVVVITIISNMPIIGLIPIIGAVFGFIGWLFGMALSLTGLGAVVLTRFGTRPYAPGGGSSYGSGPSSYKPYSPPSPPPARTDFSRESQADAELKARIKAALAEADQAPEPEAPAPADEPAGDEAPTDAPAPEKKPKAPKPKPADDPEVDKPVE